MGVLAVFIDFRNAFDLVDHKLLKVCYITHKVCCSNTSFDKDFQ